MLMASPLPARAAVRDLLTDLLGCEVTVTDGEAQRLDPRRLAQLAVYRTDDGTVTALCVADHDLACLAGAAIASVPAAEVEEARAAGRLGGRLAESYRETLDVMSRLLNTPTTPRVVLDQVHQVPGSVPPDVARLARAPGVRIDFDVELEGYGRGAMTLLGASSGAASRNRR